ncbi:MAG: bifunctional glutamate N-acetyltransferase/amino-acid acetyltransferase ArgJ [Acidimicrobiia bacterium]|nr:bifunctional glutamate N-acetyltransferase/amino-acid acetyltransferase ArgJ [Acidimicrobiia bacterium]
MSVTAAPGFLAAGTHCGIKSDGVPDLALVATADGQPVAAAGVFTSNLATAAPVQVSRRHLEATGGRAAAVVLNSGNANAATGEQGIADAERMCSLVASELGCQPEHVLVCSTGLIGIPLPMAPIEAGLPPLVGALSAGGNDGAGGGAGGGGAGGGGDAAEAILTTDTVRKETVVRDGGLTVGGMAKGAAMLAPNMATMLAVLTTDAAVEPGVLHRDLQQAVANTFNSLSVDGCTSTNDTVIVLASGLAGEGAVGDVLAPLTATCRSLAEQMAADAEGATKTVWVTVTGARDVAQARRAARKVAESQLVKCSLFGADPYWGRIVSELGTARVAFDPDRAEVAYGGVTVCAKGVAVAHDADAVRVHLQGRRVEITADLGLGDGEATILTNDLTPAYIDENMRTS